MARLDSSALLPKTLFLAAVLATACVRLDPHTTATDPAATDTTQLWQAPDDLASRDLFRGPGADGPIPDADTPFAFVAADESGYSRGYDVRDRSGLQWSVKLGPEAQTEVVASRILWAIGYHQLPTFYLERWTMTGGPEQTLGPGRFRPELPGYEAVGEWAWDQNPFVHTQPYKGLIVANLILNSWDWKTSNNKIYEVRQSDGPAARRYVVRDLGASLGRTTYPTLLAWLPMRGFGQGTRNDIDGFEAQGFITAVEGDRVEFDYKGIYGPVVDLVAARDVVWTSQLLGQLSDAQWHDAFRAGGYPPHIATRYITKIKSKVAEGLALRPMAD